MKQGDYVLIPRPWRFDVYEIEDNEILCSTDMEGLWKSQQWPSVDLGFFRKVKVVETEIPREKFSSADLIRKMKFQGTNLKLSTSVSQDILDAIKRYRDNRPINIREEIIQTCEQDVLNVIKKLSSPHKFEDLVQDYFKCIGADVVTKPSVCRNKTTCADADVEAIFNNSRTIIYIQVKFQNDTSLKAIEQVKLWREEHSKQKIDYVMGAWIISSGFYSQQMQDLAIENNILLIDGHEFAKMLLKCGVEQLNAKD